MKAVESKKAASAICAILAISIMCLRLSQAQTPDSVPRKLVLEVIVKDCPHDAQIRREDLRLFSDGTAEAHSLSTFRWYDSVEERKISVHEYDVLRAILENRELLQVKYRYERMYPVMDSWTEREIRVRHQSGDQTIEISAFSPSSARESKKAYPDVLTKPGCSIWKLRRELFDLWWIDDDRNGECRHALEVP